MKHILLVPSKVCYGTQPESVLAYYDVCLRLSIAADFSLALFPSAVSLVIVVWLAVRKLSSKDSLS